MVGRERAQEIGPGLGTRRRFRAARPMQRDRRELDQERVPGEALVRPQRWEARDRVVGQEHEQLGQAYPLDR